VKIRILGSTAAVLLIGIAILVPVTFAATLEKGTVELQTNASFVHSSYSSSGEHIGNTTLVNVAAGVGYCVSSLFEIDGGLQVVHTSADVEGVGSISATAFGATGGVTLNLPLASESVVPFVSAGLGVLTFSGDGYSNSETALTAPYVRAGLRVLVGPMASVNFGLAYAHQTNAEGVKDLDNNQLGLSVGISIFPNRH
jgi:hypothetical protein